MQRILQNLLAEGVSIRNLAEIIKTKTKLPLLLDDSPELLLKIPQLDNAVDTAIGSAAVAGCLVDEWARFMTFFAGTEPATAPAE